ncbi:MAG: family N-acetyltransferase [Solirubrobacterales bacterium]|nr:family N-acetyltransferase [Solirubrobacterales bacterium]
MITHPHIVTRRRALEVRGFEPDDEPAVLELLRTSFGEWPREMSAADPSEFFRWKHAGCPFGPSTMYVADVAGAIVGFEARLPWRMEVGAEVLTASRGTDLAVHPAHRGLGLSLALRRAAVFPREVAFTWSNPNTESLPGSLRFGRTLVGKVPRFVSFGGRPRATMLRAVGQEWPVAAPLEIDAPTARQVLADGTSAAVHRPEPSPRLATVRDLDYLRWRYAFEDYRAVRAKAVGRGDGIAIFRARRWGRLWGFDVCELIVHGDDPLLARGLLRQVADTAPVDFIRCSFRSRSTAARHGFVQYPGRTVLMTTPLREGITPDPTRMSSWALTGGDLELL